MTIDKKTAIIIVICLIGFISFRLYIAFNASSFTATVENNQESFNFPLELPAVFTGTLPCASCPGIETHLLVDSTGFREITRYIDENGGYNTTYGTWEVTGNDSLFLESNNERYKIFIIENDSLRLLDQSGNRIEGDLAENYLLTYSDMENQIRSRHEELRLDGFKFIASGNEPFWSVQVTGKDYVIYQTPEMRKSGELDQRRFDSSSTELIAQFGSGETLELNISDEICQDSMSGFMFSHTVTIQYEGVIENGCGRFLNEVWSSK
jgi:uncharacterized membrane protein